MLGQLITKKGETLATYEKLSKFEFVILSDFRRRYLELGVHGSLARAGKVKSQTPKVDKQEKKKTPKGRAKKRLLYNRRCVHIVWRNNVRRN